MNIDEMFGVQTTSNSKGQIFTFKSPKKELVRKGIFLSSYINGADKGGTIKVLQDTNLYFPNIDMEIFLKRGSTFKETQEIDLESWTNGEYEFEYFVGTPPCNAISTLTMTIQEEFKWELFEDNTGFSNIKKNYEEI